MTFDPERTVSAILRLADLSANIEQSKKLMSADLNNAEVGVRCLSDIQCGIRKAYEIVPVLIDAVSHDTVGSRRGGLNELLVRAIRLVAMHDQGALLFITRQYPNLAWCASAPEMLGGLACEVLRATADIKYGQEPRKSAQQAFLQLQQLGAGRLGDWLLEGAPIAEIPELKPSCNRLWAVLNIGNKDQSDRSSPIRRTKPTTTAVDPDEAIRR